MKTWIAEIKISLLATAALAVLVCGLYPLSVHLLGRGLFHGRADGSLVTREGTAVGSSLIGRAFEGPGYFHPRPSAAGAGYDGTASGGSNLGPLSRALSEAVARRAAAYREENGLPAAVLLPADAVTASASGLDPHISPANARLQAGRVARTRGLAPAPFVRVGEGGHVYVIGTAAARAVEQAADLESATGCARHELEADILGDPGCRPEIDALARQLALADRDVILKAAPRRPDQSASPQDVVDGLAELAFVMLRTRRPASLYLSGGDTAAGVLHRLGAAGLDLLEEVTPGMVLGIVRGGQADGLYVVTKPGAFGQPDALVRLSQYWKEHQGA